jgi:formylglycine-generating enzyme required for sulfatase activity
MVDVRLRIVGLICSLCLVFGGVVYAQDVTVAPHTDDLPTMNNLVVSLRVANIRALPNTESDIVDTVNAGVALDEVSQAVVDDVLWYEVARDGETLGWISSQVANLVVQWQTKAENFDDVRMVYVPAGCFLMGSVDGEDDEQPVHLQCFEEPFWIDQFEVTNGQYGEAGYYEGDSRPRENVTWFEAQAFCEARDARLPTEREWAYAARSPSNLIFPWGDEYIDDNVVSSWIETKRRTEAVGTRPDGVSWVGAFDMSGNVWEWTSSLYAEYPYVSNDGREDAEENGLRVVRGGACCSYIIADVRATYRFAIDPYLQDPNVGFRCVRDIEG